MSWELALRLYSEIDEYMYDVVYIVNNGRENNVRERFIKLHIEDTGPRNRAGRCKYVIVLLLAL